MCAIISIFDLKRNKPCTELAHDFSMQIFYPSCFVLYEGARAEAGRAEPKPCPHQRASEATHFFISGSRRFCNV